ncbi:KilA-N domain-containing protein [Methylovulum miyakonense]|uniref:KilA-N domain-containing protein n=1 Tax=Methylovulum miyakonense TaxID=645578 RepID=UPI000365E2CC|nr:KilA-N domain-containing protein [Methylovulum miyakonense]
MLTIRNVGITEADGLYCLNDLHKAGGGEERHKPANWLRTQQAIELVAVLEAEAGNAKSLISAVSHIRATEQNQILTVIQGGVSSQQGTFVCRELVYAYATWVSPVFFLHVLRAYDALIQAGTVVPDECGDNVAALQRALVSMTERTDRHDMEYRRILALSQGNYNFAHSKLIVVEELRKQINLLHETIRQMGRK